MTDWPIVGVAGARGVVGNAFLSILADAGLPADALRAFGSEEGSVGYGDGSVPTRPLDEEAASELEVLFLATDGATSRQIVGGPGRAVSLIVDNSSAFRLDPRVPLVVPEANGHAVGRRTGNLIANPNCTTAAAVIALAPIRDLAGLESVDLASYQAVSGAGRAALDAYEAERAAGGTDRAEGSPFHGRIADNVVPQIDVLDDEGWTGEEHKIMAELRKILELPELDVSATAVRVPVHTGHSVALHIRTAREVPLREVMEALAAAPGVEYRHATGSNRHPMPLDAVGRDPVLVGRLRGIPGRPRGLALFLSSDNLRKGAALNAIQIAACADAERFGRLVPPAR